MKLNRRTFLYTTSCFAAGSVPTFSRGNPTMARAMVDTFSKSYSTDSRWINDHHIVVRIDDIDAFVARMQRPLPHALFADGNRLAFMNQGTVCIIEHALPECYARQVTLAHQQTLASHRADHARYQHALSA